MFNSNEDIFSKTGLKTTKSRIMIVKILQNAEVPLAADEIFMRLIKQKLKLNLSTVYRTLETMEAKGLVEKCILNDGKARYELIDGRHRHHLICTQCHISVPIEACPLKQLEKDVEHKTNFEITGHRMELYGVCPDCKLRDGQEK